MPNPMHNDGNFLNGRERDVHQDTVHGTESRDNGSLLLDVMQALEAVKTLERATHVQTFTSVEGIGLDSTTVTVEMLRQKMEHNTQLFLEVVAGTFPAATDIAPVIGGVRLEGVTVVSSGPNSARLTMDFYNNVGCWKRDINSYVSAGSTSARDLGWRQITTDAGIEELTTTRVTAYGNLLSAFLLGGQYTTSQPAMAQFTDNPYVFFGLGAQRSIVQNRRLYSGDHTLQSVTSLFGGQEFYRDIVAGTTGTWRMVANSSVSFTSSNALNFAGGTITNTLNTSGVIPRTTNAYTIGSASLTYSNGYFQNAPTVVSDERAKSQIAPIPDEVLDAWAKVLYSQWKLNSAIAEKGEEEARLHVGIVAQHIRDTFADNGLDATKYGILIHDSWDATPEIPAVGAEYDEDGVLIKEPTQYEPAKEAGDIWMVRMEECLAMEAALMRRTQQRLEARLAALEAK